MTIIGQDVIEKLCGCCGVTACAVPVVNGDVELAAQVAKTIRRQLWKHFPRQSDGAKFLTDKVEAMQAKVMLNK